MALRIFQICKKEGISHLHAHDSPAHTFGVMSAALFGNAVPLIVHRRVDFPIGKNGLSKWKYNHQSVSRIICVSDFIRRVMEPDLKAPEKLAVVHSGIDVKRFSKQDNGLKTNRLRSEFNIPAGHFIVANIAAIAPHKDYFTFVKTAGILVEQGFPASFLAIGADGGEAEQVKHFIEEKKLTGRVILTGFRNDLAEVLPEIDLLLFTSKTEGLGTALVDAFACGVPVVATRAGGIPEVVEHEKSGILCEVGDAICLAEGVKNVLTDTDLRKKLTENARLRLPFFTKEKMAAAILEIYRSTKF